MITNLLHDKPILSYIDVGFAHINRDWTNETFSQVVNKLICNWREIEWRIHHYRLHRQHLLLHVNSQFVNDTRKGIYMQIARIPIQKWVPHCCSNKYSALDKYKATTQKYTNILPVSEQNALAKYSKCTLITVITSTTVVKANTRGWRTRIWPISRLIRSAIEWKHYMQYCIVRNLQLYANERLFFFFFALCDRSIVHNFLVKSTLCWVYLNISVIRW